MMFEQERSLTSRPISLRPSSPSNPPMMFGAAASIRTMKNILLVEAQGANLLCSLLVEVASASGPM